MSNGSTPQQKRLCWENGHGNGAPRRFGRSLSKLLRHPRVFFQQMAPDGGLNEPLTFFWWMAGSSLLLSFPVALLSAGFLTPETDAAAPSAARAPLLVPQLAGLLLLLAPVLLPLGGVLLIGVGSAFYLGARFFGADRWEPCVSLVCYAKGAAYVPFVLGELSSVLLLSVCHLATALRPEQAPALGKTARYGLMTLAVLAVICGLVLFLLTLITGCVETFQLDGASGTASALAGLLVALAAFVACPASWYLGGLGTGWKTTLAVAVVLLILWLLSRIAPPATGLRSSRP